MCPVRTAVRLAHRAGFEPTTPRFVVWCSIQLSYRCLPSLRSSRQARGRPEKRPCPAATPNGWRPRNQGVRRPQVQRPAPLHEHPSWFCQNEVPTLPWARPSSARKRCKSGTVASRPGPSARLRILSPPAPRGLDEATGPIIPTKGQVRTCRTFWPALALAFACSRQAEQADQH
jgi:hypothetical protein